jgi:hypothetical protein
MSRLRRPFLYDRYIFVTAKLLMTRMRQEQRFALTAWAFLPDPAAPGHAIIYPPHPLSIAQAMSERSADLRP